MRRVKTVVALLCANVLAVAGVVLAGALPASAQETGWADWEPLSGSAGNYTTTMQQLAAGFPEATMTSDSRAGSVGVISGASTWLSADTPPGQTYGSSRNRPYLNLRPRADNADAPSTTTYTFERPTPAGGWAFVLGDIDADEVTVTAKGPDGQPVAVGNLGFQGEFNYCDAAGSPSCTGGDLPSWDPATATLTGNEDAADTAGASGWFEPTVPIKSLTFVFRWRSGFPVYQTWFASLARDISGTVTGPDDESVAGSTLKLFGPDGTELATTTPDEEGNYEFPGYTAANGYEVEIIPPSRYTLDETAGEAGQQRRPADLAEEDAAEVDFALREIIPVEVNGTVTDTDGNPIPGATVTLDGLTATTDSDGFYVFEDVPPGDYEFGIEELDGYTVETTPDPITVPDDSEEPIENNDFVLAPLPSLSGSVTAGGSPVGNVTVTIEGPDGFTDSTVTDSDGTYEFDGLPPGDYTVTVEPPDGYQVVDDEDSLDATVEDDDVTDVDFALFRPGAIGGTVLDDSGDFVPGATIEITGPDGTETLTTDEEGNYYLDDLSPGDYTITITPPDRYTVVGDESLEVTLTAAGESRLDQDFEVAAEDDAVPPDEEDDTTPDTAPDDEETLPDTGAGVAALAGLGTLLIAGGVAALNASARGRRSLS